MSKRANFEWLPNSKDPRDEMTRQEFEEAVRSMKKDKAKEQTAYL